jgi:uncharacterized LabA/DUF88 family protein
MAIIYDAKFGDAVTAQLEKTALFIDGANLYATTKSLGFVIDYKRLLREFQSSRHLPTKFARSRMSNQRQF